MPDVAHELSIEHEVVDTLDHGSETAGVEPECAGKRRQLETGVERLLAMPRPDEGAGSRPRRIELRGRDDPLTDPGRIVGLDERGREGRRLLGAHPPEACDVAGREPRMPGQQAASERQLEATRRVDRPAGRLDVEHGRTRDGARSAGVTQDEVIPRRQRHRHGEADASEPARVVEHTHGHMVLTRPDVREELCVARWRRARLGSQGDIDHG